MSTVAEFLIKRMQNAHIRHVFGVPGDYVLKFYSRLERDKGISLINTADETGAGFAADAYARVHGIGCVVVTYNVGALKIANSVACAYAEKSPLVVISGSPGIKEREEGALLHHMVRSFSCQKRVFENITCASAVLSDPSTAGYEIDRVFEYAQHMKQPVYIELPRDVAEMAINYDIYRQGTPEFPPTDEDTLAEAIEEVKERLEKAERPVMLAGVEVARFGMGEQLIKFCEQNHVPVATTMLSKSVIDEQSPLFLGVYSGNSSQEGVQEAVENSDCLLMMGVMLSDMTLSFKPCKFSRNQAINASMSGVQIYHHHYNNIRFEDFTKALFGYRGPTKKIEIQSRADRFKREFFPREERITVKRLFEKLNAIIEDNTVVIADIGDGLFGACDLVMSRKNTFLGSAFYTSMGTAIPGALGVQTAIPDHRPIVIVGDGAFKMSAAELGTIKAQGLSPIVFVINNHGYATERLLLEGDFNETPEWQYHRYVDLIGGGKGERVSTEVELEEVVTRALKDNDLWVINVDVDKADASDGLKRLAAGLSKRV